MILFQNIKMTNFLSIGETSVDIPLNRNPTTLIKGSNGAGKTTILDGTIYALFGKPLRDVKVAQLINSVNKRKMLVTIKFSVNGSEYEVHRGQKPAIFEIHKDGKQVEALSSVKDLQKILEVDILGTNYRTFTQVITVASTGHKRFMELTPQERRVVVEQMLDIEVISKMSEKLKERYKEVRTKSSLIDNKISSVNQSISSVKRLIESVSSVSDDQIEALDLQAIELKKLDEQYKKDLDEMRTRYNDMVSKKPEHDQEHLTTSRIALDNNISTFKVDSISATRISNEAKTLATFYTTHDHCDRCSQPIDKKFKSDTVNDLSRKYEENLEIVSTLTEKINDTEKEKIDILSKLNDISLWQQSCNLIIQEGNLIQSKIKSNQQAVLAVFEQKQKLLDKGNENIQEYHNELESHNKTISDILQSKSEITEEMEMCNLCSEMLKDSGLKSKIIKQYLPIINKSINDLLDAMNAPYSFILDEQFNETIKSRYRDTFSYGSFSNGEKQRIDSVILFMWRKLAESKNTVSSKLLILDEVLDGSLDKEGIDNLFDIFATMEKSNIFIVSHRPEIVDRFDSTIQVEKVGNFSKYTTEE